MTWLQRFRIRHYVENSIWIVPTLSIFAALVAVSCLHSIDERLGWISNIRPDPALTLLSTMASSLFTFIVFVSTALLVALQLASAQLTPRFIGLVFRSHSIKVALATFVFSFTFTLSTLVRIKTTVPFLTSYLAGYGCLVSLGLFLFLMDGVGKALRPSGALTKVSELGRKVVQTVYPLRIGGSVKPESEYISPLEPEPTYTISNSHDGVVLAFETQGLVALATSADCVIELVPQIGDFVASEDPLFRITQGKRPIPAETLYRHIAFGKGRELEHDPAFAFRILVDIALKALSPAINDPTSAVLAIDQIHHLLRNVGQRRLDNGRIHDAEGQLRLVYRTPDWEDFVQLSATEIRQFGANSIQVARRLRAMLEDLIDTLPKERALPLRRQLTLLQRSVEHSFSEPEDKAMADIGDLQGLGSGQDYQQNSNIADRFH
jgi:uncharacterized membrane protein